MRGFAVLICFVAIHGVACAQIVQVTAGQLISPTVLDFDSGGAPAPGVITGMEAYFTAVGISQVSIINNPGVHTVSGDALSSGFVGNCLASVNNTLSIVAPNGAMDNHTVGAGWSFQFGGSVYSQFGCLITDQTNHTMVVETWLGGMLQNTFSFVMAGGFPNPYIYFYDAGGFDEVRFMNDAITGGWGIDDFTFGGQCAGAGMCPPLPPLPPAAWQINTSGATLTVNNTPDPGATGPLQFGSVAGTIDTINLSSISTGMPWDIAVTSPESGVPLGGGGFGLVASGQTINIDLFAPSLSLVFLGSFTNAFFDVNLPFTSPAALDLSAQMVILEPANPDGLLLSHLLEYSAIVCATTMVNENFDSFGVGGGTPTTPGTYAPCWLDGGGTYGWQARATATTSGSTGPTTGNGGSGNYLYCETSAPAAAGNTYIINLPGPITTTAGTVDFAYHMWGATMGTLELQELQAGGWTMIWSLNGDQGNAWTAAPTQNTTTNPTNLRFLYTRGTSFTGDCAIDDVVVQ